MWLICDVIALQAMPTAADKDRMASIRFGGNATVTIGGVTMGVKDLRIDTDRAEQELRPRWPSLLQLEFTTVCTTTYVNKRWLRRLGYRSHFHRKHSRGVRRGWRVAIPRSLLVIRGRKHEGAPRGL